MWFKIYKVELFSYYPERKTKFFSQLLLLRPLKSMADHILVMKLYL